jgi:hypothetical protein
MMLDQHTFWLETLGKCTEGKVVDTKRLQEMFWYTARSKVQQMIPRVRIPWSQFSQMQVTHVIEGLNWAMPEGDFLKRFGQFKSERFPWGHPGIVAIKFCYSEEHVPEASLRFDGKVLITFVSETLGYLFVQDFHGYTGMDSDQYWRGAYTRVRLATKGGIYRSTKKDKPYGDARFDEEVWNCLPPCNARQYKYEPKWEDLQEQWRKDPSSEYSKKV